MQLDRARTKSALAKFVAPNTLRAVDRVNFIPTHIPSRQQPLPCRPQRSGTTTKMSSSELSSPLSSLPSDDGDIPDLLLDGPDGAAVVASDDEPSTPVSTASSAIKRKREESPPHEEVLADNPDIAVSLWRVHHVPNTLSLGSRTFVEETWLTYFAIICSSLSCFARDSATSSLPNWPTLGLKTLSAAWLIPYRRRKSKACCVLCSHSSSTARNQ